MRDKKDIMAGIKESSQQEIFGGERGGRIFAGANNGLCSLTGYGL